jgi:hypothetical protein
MEGPQHNEQKTVKQQNDESHVPELSFFKRPFDEETKVTTREDAYGPCGPHQKRSNHVHVTSS